MSAEIVISSPVNPLVRRVRALRQRKARLKTGLFVVEGIHHVGEAIEAGWGIEALLYAPDLLTSDYARRLVREQAGQGMRCQTVTADVFACLADKDNPQGILAVVRQRHLSLERLAPENFVWGAAIVSPQDPGNVGAILRTLDAVNASGLILVEGGVDIYHPVCVRASMGALFWKYAVETSFHAFVSWARRYKYSLIGSSAHAGADYHDLRGRMHNSILVLGSEQKGLTPQQAGACDLVVAIPMLGRSSSLNLAVAAGILLFSMADKK